MRLDELRIMTPRITPIEAQLAVLATWTDEDSASPPPVLSGRIVGPYCEYAKTLTDRIPLVRLDLAASPPSTVLACARILEPCFWDPQHPFWYEVSIELHHMSRVVDMRRIFSGIRHLATDGLELLLNGQPFLVQGVKHFANSSISELEAWHDVGCNAFLTDAPTELYDRTDRWGPMMFQMLLPTQVGDATAMIKRLRNHPSLLMWVLPPSISGDALEIVIELIRAHDRSRCIGRLVSMNESTQALSPVDILLMPIGHPEISSGNLEKPYIVVSDSPAATVGCTPDTFDSVIGGLRDSLESREGLVGVIL